MNKNQIPVLYVGAYKSEVGSLPYLDDSVIRAKQSGNSIILLGQPNRLADASYYIEDYESSALNFDEAYKHLAYYSDKFARMSFRRWFVIRDFMKVEKIDRVFLCENDVLLFCDITKQLQSYQNSALSTPGEQGEYEWCSSGHCALWNIDDLDRFCEFALKIYREKVSVLEEKWNYHKEHNLPGGICDMTLFYLFCQENKIDSLLSMKDGSFFDDNINVGHNFFQNEYEKEIYGIKKIRKMGSDLFAQNLKLNEQVKVNALHFSGTAKKYLTVFNSESLLKLHLLRSCYVVMHKVKSKLGYK